MEGARAGAVQEAPEGTEQKVGMQQNHTALLSSLDAEGRSRLRSCGGPLAAGWQLASPAFPSERLEDGEYRLTARALLDQDIAQAGRTCRCKRSTGDRVGQTCDAALCRQAHHAYRCAVGGGLKQRSIAVEDVYAGIHRECGFQVDRQVAVPAWDRFRWRCRGANCSEHGVLFAPPVGPCGACGSALDTTREEAVLRLEVRSAEVPRLFLDVTVRHGVPGCPGRLVRTAGRDGATNHEAEQDKRERYPEGRSPWRALPLALESYGRHGKAALLHLRGLAREQVARLVDGGGAAASLLLLRWGCRLSVALHRANARGLRRVLGADAAAWQLGRLLSADLAG